MPHFTSSSGDHACEIYYEVKGEAREASTSQPLRPDVVLVMGFGATHACWAPQLDELLRGKAQGDPPRTRVLMLDNRGVGRSGSPKARAAYSTTIMASDIIALLDHLGWGRVHLVGHSMGAMIAEKVAMLQPTRVLSLLLISATGGGWQAVPRSWTCLKICIQIMFFARTARQRAWLDLQLHFNRETLHSVDPRYGKTREELLQESYVEGSEGGGPGQPVYGFKGQLHAVWTHCLSDKEVRLLRGADIPTMVIHGRYDLMAHPSFGEALARRLKAPCVMLEGAHMLCRERGPEVNLLLHRHIFHGRRLKDTQHKFLIGDPDPMPGLGVGDAESSPPAKAARKNSGSDTSAGDDFVQLQRTAEVPA